MEKNQEYKNKFLLKMFFCFTLLLIVFLLMYPNNSFATSEDTSSEYCYLSDIPYTRGQSGWQNILMDKTSSGSLISVKIEGAYYSFQKGIWAHASSILEYDLTNYKQYDYFTAYIGLNQTAASSSNGVKFYIYTSEDGEIWRLRTDSNPVVVRAGDNATFVKIDIKDAKFLKLQANDNGSNGNDHSVYADAKLIKETYKEEGEELVPSIKELDEKIKTDFGDADLTNNEEYELLLLKRELINRVGNYALRRFLSESELNKETYLWLTTNVDVLRLYILGGKPEGGSYYNSLNVLARLYDNYKEDFEIEETTEYGTVLGDLYKKMAVTLSLTHSQRVALWMQPSATENQSDPVTRYQIYKDLHKNGKFVATSSLDITKWFEEYSVEEMRFVLNNIIDDEEILWLNEYTQKYIDSHQNQVWKYLTPHPYMKYIWPNYSRPEFHDETKKEMWDEKYDFLRYGVTFRPGLYKLWMNLENGSVCGGISKIGSNIRTVHGIPAAVIGQPGHAAIIYYTKDAQGRGAWSIDNDVSGWTLSEKGERMLLGWGNASYTRGSYQIVYMLLAQEVLNDYASFEKCEETIMLANIYNDDLEKQEDIYREALEVQPINIDAWYGLINVYLANDNKTEDEYFELAEELAENLKCFPLPMYHLTNLIKPKLTSIENSYKFTLLQTRILTEGSNLPNNTADKYYVYQPSVTRLEANYLLGKIDKTIATFSFDGADSGKIVLSSRFDGNGIRWDYSLDGKENWIPVEFAAEEEHKLQLTQEQIKSITAENDIYVHIVGVGYEEKNLYKIDITEQALLSNLYANDLENRIVGVNLNTEWRYNENDEWTSYSVSSPDLTGDKTVQVRQSATGTKLTSPASPMYTFTEDNQLDTRKYIPVSHLSIHGVSTQAVNNGGAAINVIDGNYNTRWHSAWNGTDTERFIIVKLDRSVCLSAVEYVPAGRWKW